MLDVLSAPATGNGAKRRQPVLMPQRFGLAEQKRRDFVANVEIGVTPDEITNPGFWSHIAPELSPMDVIEVRPDDCAWIAHLRVLYAERNYAKVVVERLFIIETKEKPDAESLTHKVEWKGPHHRFAVIRTSDAAMLKAEFRTREEANTWMVEYEKAVR